MSTPSWIEVKVSFKEEPADWSLYADAFDRHGCPGSLIEGATIVGYLSDLPAAQEIVIALDGEMRRLGADLVEVRHFEEQDWSELWRIHFKTRRIGTHFVIKPSWEEYTTVPGDVVIELDPGQAFGTGDHPTTRLCLSEMEKVHLNGASFADIGCGSGVLAIGASLLGANVVMASDLDTLSVEITNQNAARNGVDFLTAIAAGFDALEGSSVDVAVSNIISATLIRLAPEAAVHVKAEGHWIVSGIIQGNWPDVRAAAESVGFTLVSESLEDEWIGATFRR